MKLIKPLAVAVIQVIFFVAVYSLSFYAFEKMGYKSSSNIGWGLSLRFGLYIFAAMVLIINYLWILKLSTAKKNILLAFFIMLFIVFSIRDIGYTPYKTTLFLCCAVLAFLSKYFFDRIIKTKAP